MEETHRAMHGEGVWSLHDLSMGTVLPEFSHGHQLGLSQPCPLGSMETSLHMHDSLNHWLLGRDSACNTLHLPRGGAGKGCRGLRD